VDKNAKKRVVIRLTVAALLLASFVTVLFSVIGGELRQLEVASNRRAVSAALNEQVVQLAKIADDNALWDEAAQSIYQRLDLTFVESAWGGPMTYGSVYDEVAVVSPKSEVAVAFSKGKQASQTTVNLHSPDVVRLIATARSKGKATGGIVKAGGGLQLVAVAHVLPTSSALNSIVPKSGPSVLMLSKALTDEELAMIAEQVQLSGLTWSRSSGEDSLKIVSPSGADLGTISWLPTGLTNSILKAALPLPLVMLVLSLVLIAWMALSSEGSIARLRREGQIDPCTGLNNLRSLEDQLTGLRNDGLMLIICRIECEDQNLARVATRKAYQLQLSQNRNYAYRAWLETGAIAFAWVGKPDPETFQTKVAEYTKSLTTSLSDLPGASGLSFGFGVAAQAHSNEPLLDIAARGITAAGTALHTVSGSLRMADHPVASAADNRKAERAAPVGPQALPLNRIRFSPILNPETRKIVSFEPMFGDVQPGETHHNSRPWLNPAQKLEDLTASQRDLISHVLHEATAWQGCNLTLRISANVACHPRFPEWLQTKAEEIIFPLQSLEIIIVTHSTREAARSLPVLASLAQMGIAPGMEFLDASISALQALADTPDGFVALRMGKHAEPVTSQSVRKSEALVSAANAFAIPILFSDVTTHRQQGRAEIAGVKRLEGAFYLAPVDTSKIARLLENQNFPQKRPQLRLAQ
jgi:sensor domain CHASE-containing protein/EAL domain-containing protein (putative c-di-GMP-specific phosphodiesterase class I)